MAATTVDKRWTLEHPEVGTGLISTDRNTSEEYFEQEREKIFKQVWLNVGRIQDIPNPGDYFLQEIEVLKKSLIIVRGKDGVVRGFHNVCRHRGNRIARDCSGSAKGFACGFHGWTYDLEGNLVYLPDENLFFDFKKSDYNLIPITTDVWEGFIFVNADPHPRESLKEFMGEMGEGLAGYPFNDMQVDGRYAMTVNCNWKVFSDAFQEAYHVAFIHKHTVPDVFTSKDNPFSHMTAFRLTKFHNVASVYGNPEHQMSPLEAFARKIGTSGYGTAAGDSVSSLPRGLNPEKNPNWAFDLHNIFPNYAMHIGIGFYYTYNFWPLAVDKTRWIMTLYGYPARTAGERISKEFTMVLLRDAVKEDINTTENTQKNMASGVLPYMALCDQELLVRHKYKVVEDFVRSTDHTR